jgi:hypothetical protein
MWGEVESTRYAGGFGDAKTRRHVSNRQLSAESAITHKKSLAHILFMHFNAVLVLLSLVFAHIPR